MSTTSVKSWASIASTTEPVIRVVDKRKSTSLRHPCLVCLEYKKHNASFIPNAAIYGVKRNKPGSNKRIPTRCSQHYKEYCSTKICQYISIEECQEQHDHRYVCWFKHI